MSKYRIFDDEFEKVITIKAAASSEQEEHELLKEFVSDILSGAGLSLKEVQKFWDQEEENHKMRKNND